MTETGFQGYSAAEAEFLEEFPEMADRVRFLSPDRFADGREATRSVRDLLEQERYFNTKSALGRVPGLDQTVGRMERAQHLRQSFDLSRPNVTQFSGGTGFGNRPVNVVQPSAAWGSPQEAFGRFAGLEAHGPPDAWRGAVTVAESELPEGAWRQFFSDHELHHAASMNKSPSAFPRRADALGFQNRLMYQENAADSYATLRHYQRYGLDSKMPGTVSEMRSLGAGIGGDWDHYTSQSIDETEAFAKRIQQRYGSLDKLTPRRALKASHAIAKRATPPEAQIRALADKLYDTDNAPAGTRARTEHFKKMSAPGRMAETVKTMAPGNAVEAGFARRFGASAARLAPQALELGASAAKAAPWLARGAAVVGGVALAPEVAAAIAVAGTAATVYDGYKFARKHFFSGKSEPEKGQSAEAKDEAPRFQDLIAGKPNAPADPRAMEWEKTRAAIQGAKSAPKPERKPEAPKANSGFNPAQAPRLKASLKGNICTITNPMGMPFLKRNQQQMSPAAPQPKRRQPS
jgi:hypothetical protein